MGYVSDKIGSLVQRVISCLQFNDIEFTRHRKIGDMATDDAAVDVTVGPEDSASQVASSTSRRVTLSARRAALEAEAAFAEQQYALELEELQLKRKREALSRMVRLASLQVDEDEVLASTEDQTQTVVSVDNGDVRQTAMSDKDSEVVLNPRVQPWLPSRQPIDNVSSLQQLAIQGQQQQRYLLDAIQLPSVQIPQFDGNPLQYYSFVRLFESTVERDTVDNSSRLARLMQYSTGKARHVISGCTTMDPDVGYLRAKTLLKQRFGDEYTISEAWINKVTSGLRLKPTDGELLQNLADDLCNCFDTALTVL